MVENPEDELTVGEIYGTRDPKNQVPDPDDFAFVVRSIDEGANEIEVDYLMLGEMRNEEVEDNTLQYDEYSELLQNKKSNFYWIRSA